MYNKRKLKPILVSGAVIGLLIFLHAVSVLKPIEVLAAQALKPVLGVVYKAGSMARIFYSEQTDRRDWQAEANSLREQVNRLTDENVRLKLLEEENHELRDHLKYVESRQKKFVIANVIAGGEPNAVNQVVSIDKGSLDGISFGLAVTSSAGQVVGKIIQVSDRTAQMCLINQSDCQFAAAIQNSNKTSGIVHGDLGLTMKMDYIPQTEVIKPGQIVITSGLERNIGRGQVIGQVSEVEKENNALWQTAKIDSLTDLNSIVTVSILLP